MMTSKRFYDIIPPEKLKDYSLASKSPEEPLEEPVEVKISQKPQISFPLKPSKEKLLKEKPLKERLPREKLLSPKRLFISWNIPQKITILSLVFLIIAGIFCHFVLAKTRIVIWPETEVLSFSQTVIVDSETSQMSFQKKIIPGKIFEVEKSVSQEFSSTGKVLKEEKARGIIRVYNAYSTSSQVLVADTRFISDDGKLFRSVEEVKIPGATYEKANVLGQRKLVPASLDIEVKAAESGPDYNIGPSTFSIPGFAGTSRYTAFYGKSFSPMEGGFIDEVPKVLEEDLEKAKNTLIERLEKEGKDSLKTEISEDFILLVEGISHEVLETSSLAKAGAEVKVFNFRVKMKTKGIGFKKTDLEDFAKDFIEMNIPEAKKIHPESLKIIYSLSSIDLSEGRALLDLEFGAKVFADIDLVSLKRAILGKSLREAQVLLENQPQVIDVMTDVFPFWLGKIPQQKEKVEIELRVD